MHAIIGLGNPSSEYDGTRHNIGFTVVDKLAEKFDADFHAGRGEFVSASCRLKGEQVLLVKPLTYMNNSGVAVKEILEQHQLWLEELLVVVDDFQLPLGMLRLRTKGSDGGHNGLASIMYQLESDEFPRLRCGIQSESMPKNKNKMADFVLSSFEKKEQDKVKKMIELASDAVITTVLQGMQVAMNKVNTVKI